jgi:hypothetical protein
MRINRGARCTRHGTPLGGHRADRIRQAMEPAWTACSPARPCAAMTKPPSRSIVPPRSPGVNRATPHQRVLDIGGSNRWPTACRSAAANEAASGSERLTEFCATRVLRGRDRIECPRRAPKIPSELRRAGGRPDVGRRQPRRRHRRAPAAPPHPDGEADPRIGDQPGGCGEEISGPIDAEDRARAGCVENILRLRFPPRSPHW